MKKITASTILKQGNKMFLPVEIDKVIYWEAIDFDHNESAFYIYTKADGSKEINFGEEGAVIGETKVIAQSQPKLKGIPVISLDIYVVNKAYKYIEKLHLSLISECRTHKLLGFEEGYRANPNQYTQQDIEKAIDLAREQFDIEGFSIGEKTKESILEQINFISIIEVDEQFNIISYE